MQLKQAIRLYIEGADLISAITLAGAAEEILGIMVRKKGGKTALDKKIESMCEVFQIAYNTPADKKVFRNIRSKAKNSPKHFGSGQSEQIDLEREAAEMIDRAIQNHERLTPNLFQEHLAFQKARIERNRKRYESYA